MKCLIDLDILLYEVGSLGQYVDEITEEIVMKSFDDVASAFDQRVKEIEAEVWATEPSLFFMTNNKQLYKEKEKKKAKALKRATKKLEENPLDDVAKDLVDVYQPSKYAPNFRDNVAKKKEYKGNRKESKRPLHYQNLVEYVCATRDVICAEGCEADDLLAIYQCEAEPLTTVICSRDKDLKIIPGMHYGWACGNQQAFPLTKVTKVGTLDLLGGKKLTGTGLKFFYSQILTGDVTDNYPGLPRCGGVKAFKALNECTSEEEMFEAVKEFYRAKYGDDEWHAEMNEQAQLAWMVCELDEDGGLVHYVMYDER
jgi:5'-3' exonuclease